LALGRLYLLTGKLALAELSFSRRSRLGTQWYLDAGVVEMSLLRGDPKAPLLGDRLRKEAEGMRMEHEVIRAISLQGRATMASRDFVRADEVLHHALSRARAVIATEFELQALIAITELELQRGDHTKAKSILDEVWETAERGPYPLYQADAYNVLAAIARAEGNKSAAIDAATKAYAAAWCDGPPYAYHWGLEKAKAHLAALGAPEPDMPPFDESKFEPLPEVEINPKDEYWVDPHKLDD
jgi:hypothetical protein